jgi:hypothetical protein
MITLIFVYSSAQFRITGGSIEPFPKGGSLPLTPAGEVTLDQGIYGAFPNPMEALSVVPMQGIVATDYDKMEIAGKDIPPDLTQTTTTLGNRARPQFSSENYEALRTFIAGREA